MSVIVYRNAQLLVNGAELTAGLSDLALTSTAEMLDATVFGLLTRTKQAGLYNDSISGKGFLDTTNGVEQFVFNEVSQGAFQGALNPLVISGTVQLAALCALFPDGVTPGSTLAGSGFFVKGELDKFIIGGTVGVLTTIQFEAITSGIERADT